MGIKPPQFFEIPGGTKVARCRSCDEPIYWIKTESGKAMPVSIDHDGAYGPTRERAGLGISHFVDCAHADQHRRSR